MTTTTRTPPARCPKCGHEVNAATPATMRAAPQPGDLAVCVRCGALNQYDARLQLAAFDESQLDEGERREVALMREVIGPPETMNGEAAVGVFWEAARRSGMAEVQCPCGVIFLTRRKDAALCPPCAGLTSSRKGN